MHAPTVSFVLALALGATGPAAVSAAPVKVSDGWLVDATRDGRYVLVVGVDPATGERTNATTVIDRKTSKQWPAGTEFDAQVPPQLADHSPRVLLQRGGRLVVRDVVAGTEQQADLGPDGKPVSYDRAQLVRNGTEVIFSTGEATPRILARDLTTNTTTVRMTGVQLRDASDDGRVITYLRVLPTARRPPSAPQMFDSLPADGLDVRAAGYQVDGEAPRWVARTVFSQRASLDPQDARRCTGRATRDGDGQPIDLRVTQAGDQRYTLVASIGAISTPESSVLRLQADGSRPERLGGSSVPNSFDGDPRLDPGSTAYVVDGLSVTDRSWTTTTDDGTTRLIPSSIDVARVSGAVIPVDRGRTVVFTGVDANRRALGTFVDEGPEVGATQTGPLLTLPRPADPVDTGTVPADVSWAKCPPAVTAKAAANYAAVVVRKQGRSAGRVTIRLAPADLARVKHVRLTIRHRQHVTWSRSVTRSKRVTLPRLPIGARGYSLHVRVTLADGRVLAATTTLRRTR